MPEISRFLGIVIKMYFNDHAPPHFHVQYGEHMAMIDIEKLSVIKGRLSPRILGLVMEWASLYQTNYAKIGRAPKKNSNCCRSNLWSETCSQE